ncbi:MAG TPA: type II toxin-antitoxin system HicA family toxin [Nitrososphaera sp.]|nr:type II toxin-antitoxin system HicA family toxin [Nitrososphaera sp.]
MRNHSWRQVLKVLTRHGFYVNRQSSSHIQLAHPDGRHATVPRHDPIKEGVMKSILDQAGIPKEEFLKEI